MQGIFGFGNPALFVGVYSLECNDDDNNNNNNNNNNKVDMQFPYILVWKLHTQACEIVAGTKRKLCKKFQVDICKTWIKIDLRMRSCAPCSWDPSHDL